VVLLGVPPVAVTPPDAVLPDVAPPEAADSFPELLSLHSVVERIRQREMYLSAIAKPPNTELRTPHLSDVGSAIDRYFAMRQYAAASNDRCRVATNQKQPSQDPSAFLATGRVAWYRLNGGGEDPFLLNPGV
jgi:hypothetical protein